MTVTDRIFKLIKDNGLTAKEFANIVGLSPGNITDWKTGRAKPSVESLQKIQTKFNISMEWLLGQSNQKKYVEYKYLEIPEGFYSSYCSGLSDYLIDVIKKITFELLLENIPSVNLDYEIDLEFSFCKIPEDHIEQVKNAIITLYDYNKRYDLIEKVEKKHFYMCPVYGQISAGQPNWAEENIEGRIPIDPELMGIINPEEHFFLRVNGESMNRVIKNGAFALIHKQDYIDKDGDIAVVLVNGDIATLKHFTKKGDIVVLEPDSDITDDPDIKTQIYDKTTPIRIIGKYVGKMEINK